MSEPRILTFGCRLNSFESQIIRDHVVSAGLDGTTVINSCAVTSEAERQVRQAIRREHRQRPDARIVVTGCAAQLDPERFSSMAEVDQVVGNVEKLDPNTWSDLERNSTVLPANILAVRETSPHLISGFENRARAFVEIQQGCDHRCTFCIIPYARGPNRSVPVDVIIGRINKLVDQGYKEIVLTGVDITDYGSDLTGLPGLGRMIRHLLNLVPQLPRLRLSSLDPAEIDDDLLTLIEEEPRLMPHFHISVQSGDDLVLKQMKRRHSRSDIERFVERVRRIRPDCAFGADLIAGFPTETEEAFENSVSLVEECDLTWLHVFPFSERPGTPAARMPQLPGNVRKSRAARLRKIGTERVRQFLANCIGKDMEVLVEDGREGFTPQFARVRLSKAEIPGSLVKADIYGIQADTLMATVRP